MKPHIKVIQRNGVDIFVTSSMTMRLTKAELEHSNAIRRRDYNQARNRALNQNTGMQNLFGNAEPIYYGGSLGKVSGNPIGSL
jgi:hypothetical protein